VFGSPGLFDVANVYDVLSVKLDVCSKPIYPVLPSVINAQNEIHDFMSTGHVNFPDEVVLGRALAAIYNTPAPQKICEPVYGIDNDAVRKVIDSVTDGFMSPKEVAALLDGADIPHVREQTVTSLSEIESMGQSMGFPVVMKVIGPIHKSDVGGVILNVHSVQGMKRHFEELMRIEDAKAVLIQPMIAGKELFIGVKRESNFGHLVLCGLGGIFIEVLKDVSSCLTPVGKTESIDMIQNLKGYKVIQGIRGKEGVNEELFSETIQRISNLVTTAPEIVEMDINPLMGSMTGMMAVDTRIRICRQDIADHR